MTEEEERSLTDALGLASRGVVALVGGGGKTTAVRALAAELAAQGGRVLVTTTTAMLRREAAAVGPLVRSAGGGARGLNELSAGLAEAPAGGRPAVLVGGEREAGKVAGLSPAAVDELWAAGLADAVVVEADGSKGLPLKAFAPYEPQVPSVAATVVVVAGLDVLGAPLTEERVHRAGALAALLGARPGSPVTAEVLAGGLRAQVGRVRESCGDARVVVLLNKADAPGARAAGLAVARALLGERGPAADAAGGERPDRVVVGSLHEGWFVIAREGGRT